MYIQNPFSITERIQEIMESFHSSFVDIKYFIGQKNLHTNLGYPYIIFYPVSESTEMIQLKSGLVDGYQLDFCCNRLVQIRARIHAKDIETLHKYLYGIVAAIKVNNGPNHQISVDWMSQQSSTGITREGEIAEVVFKLTFPVPNIKSFLVTPEFFEVQADFVTDLPDGYYPISNPDGYIPGFYDTGKATGIY